MAVHYSILNLSVRLREMERDNTALKHSCFHILKLSWASCDCPNHSAKGFCSVRACACVCVFNRTIHLHGEKKMASSVTFFSLPELHSWLLPAMCALAPSCVHSLSLQQLAFLRFVYRGRICAVYKSQASPYNVSCFPFHQSLSQQAEVEEESHWEIPRIATLHCVCYTSQDSFCQLEIPDSHFDC